MLTGADGTYQLDGVTPGPYAFVFVDPGAERLRRGDHLDASDYTTATPIEIDVDVVANVDATLTHAATIQGVVADSSGNPLDGIVVSGTTPGNGDYDRHGRNVHTSRVPHRHPAPDRE